MRHQFGVYEVEEFPIALGEKFLPLPAVRFALICAGVMGIVFERCGPVLPPEGAGQRWSERLSHRLGGFAVALLLRVEDAKKQNPRKLRYVLQCARAVRSPHDVTDGLDERRERAGGLDRSALLSRVPHFSCHHCPPSTDSDTIR